MYYGAADVHSNNTCLGIIDQTPYEETLDNRRAFNRVI
jgi:hypothetical protein